MKKRSEIDDPTESIQILGTVAFLLISAVLLLALHMLAVVRFSAVNFTGSLLPRLTFQAPDPPFPPTRTEVLGVTLTQ